MIYVVASRPGFYTYCKNNNLDCTSRDKVRQVNTMEKAQSIRPNQEDEVHWGERGNYSVYMYLSQRRQEARTS